MDANISVMLRKELNIKKGYECQINQNQQCYVSFETARVIHVRMSQEPIKS